MLLLSSLYSWQFTRPNTKNVSSRAAINIPSEYLQRYQLRPCQLSRLEEEFSQVFPGRIETYAHDKGTVIFRQVSGATRRLHDSSTCLMASGFKLTDSETVRDSEGREWKVYTARNAKNRMKVRSTIIALDSPCSWASVEQWYWKAFFNSQKHRYLAITELEDMSSVGQFY